MNDREKNEIKNVVRETIQNTVNGKIDKLTEEIISLRKSQEDHIQRFDNHIKDVDFVIQEKENIKRFITGIKGMGLLRGALVWIAISITAIVGAIISIKSLLK